MVTAAFLGTPRQPVFLAFPLAALAGGIINFSLSSLLPTSSVIISFPQILLDGHWTSHSWCKNVHHHRHTCLLDLSFAVRSYHIHGHLPHRCPRHHGGPC